MYTVMYVCVHYTYITLCVCSYTYLWHVHITGMYTVMYVCVHYTYIILCMCSYTYLWYAQHTIGWLRLVGLIKSQDSFAEYSLFYRTLFQQRQTKHIEPGGGGLPLKHLVQILRGGFSSSGFLVRESAKQEIPPGGVGSCDQLYGVTL